MSGMNERLELERFGAGKNVWMWVLAATALCLPRQRRLAGERVVRDQPVAAVVIPATVARTRTGQDALWHEAPSRRGCGRPPLARGGQSTATMADTARREAVSAITAKYRALVPLRCRVAYSNRSFRDLVCKSTGHRIPAEPL